MGDKYTCGLCLKRTCKGAKAVLCRKNNLRWYHLKCKSLSNDSFKKLGKLNILWGCDEWVKTKSNKVSMKYAVKFKIWTWINQLKY